MSVATLAQTIVAFLAIVGVGVVLRATGTLKPADAKPLNSVIVYVGLPAFIFRAVYQARLESGLIRVVAGAWIVFAVMALLGWLGARMLRLPPKIAGGFIIAVALGNTGYIGYPLTQAVFGSMGMPDAVFYDVFCTAVALVVFGFAIAQRYGEADTPARHPIVELLRFPPVVALVVGLLLRPVPLPLAVRDGLDLAASMVAPLIMLSVGLALRPHFDRRHLAPIAGVVGLRLLVAPVVALGLGLAFAASGVPLRVFVLEAGMPTMMMTLVAGERFGLDTDFIASAIFLTTLLSAITLPLMQLIAFR